MLYFGQKNKQMDDKTFKVTRLFLDRCVECLPFRNDEAKYSVTQRFEYSTSKYSQRKTDFMIDCCTFRQSKNVLFHSFVRHFVNVLPLIPLSFFPPSAPASLIPSLPLHHLLLLLILLFLIFFFVYFYSTCFKKLGLNFISY